ncbi:cytochrome P450 CYP82D47-like protein, partial [Tanacetum coccineum]
MNKSVICSVKSKQKKNLEGKTTRYEVKGCVGSKALTGVGQALVVSDAELAKECFNTSDMVFATRPKALAAELMGYNYATFGLGPYGDYWRTMHKMVMIEVLSQRRVEMLTYIRLPEVRGSMKNIYEACFLELLETFVVSDFLPYLKCLDLGGYQKERKKTAKEIDSILEGWLEEHRKQRESGEHQNVGENDFMNVLISIREDTSRQEFMGFDHDTMIKATSL